VRRISCSRVFRVSDSRSTPGAFGAAFFIPTAVVPPLLVTHALIFLILVRPRVPGDRREA
jgi:hypothetical protein